MEDIEKITAGHPATKSADLIAENIEQLKQIFPEVIKEGKVDFEALQDLLGNYIDPSEERFCLNWSGKSNARREAQKRSTGTLRPCPEESVDWDTTQNLYIEGDNLEVLKLLQKSYHNAVKMIYIDPPYNTGKDFVYKDNYKDNMANYLEITGQDKSLSTNTESDGRYHSNWLNMMYPRLKLAHSLLKEDGVIFISIDDNEVANLRKVCDEIFGEDSCIGQFIWKRRVSSSMTDNNVSIDHEYVLVYHRSNFESFEGNPKNFDKYSNPDNDPRGPWISDNLTVGMTASMRPNQAYDLIDPKTGIVYPYNPNRVWAFIPESMGKLISEGRVIFPEDNSKRPMQKRFQYELKSSNNPFSSIMIDKVGLNTEATRAIQDILDGNLFDYSKPLSLLYTLIPQVCDKNSIILDFFSGSATTAHAVMQLNAEDGGNRKYIMVQLPEQIEENSEAYKAGYKNICEIGKERIRRARKKILEEQKGKATDLFDAGKPKLDVGFKVFKLDSSNINTWDGSPENLQDALFKAVQNIKADRSQQDLLYEILIKYGIDLVQPIKEHTFAGQKVYVLGAGALMVCLGNHISTDTVQEMAQLKKDLNPDVCRVVFKDTGFEDNPDKTNAIQILKQAGIVDVATV